jgi:hypothetical protein
MFKNDKKLQIIDAFCKSYDYHTTWDLAGEQDAYEMERNVLRETFELLQNYRKELRKDAYEQYYSKPQTDKDREDACPVCPSGRPVEPDSGMCGCKRHIRICISS